MVFWDQELIEISFDWDDGEVVIERPKLNGVQLEAGLQGFVLEGEGLLG